MDGSTLALVLAGAAAAAALLVWARRVDAAELIRPRRPDPGPADPCWTEEIGREGELRYCRGQCVDDLLMETDARAARGEFPVPRGD